MLYCCVMDVLRRACADWAPARVRTPMIDCPQRYGPFRRNAVGWQRAQGGLHAPCAGRGCTMAVRGRTGMRARSEERDVTQTRAVPKATEDLIKAISDELLA